MVYSGSQTTEQITVLQSDTEEVKTSAMVSLGRDTELSQGWLSRGCVDQFES